MTNQGFQKGNKYEFKKGHKIRLGIKHTVETKQKISEKRKGKSWGKHTLEWKRKMSETLKGENHYRWKGGITPLTRQIRHCFKYRQWHSDIFTRDNFTCILCGKKGCWLEVDHYPKLFSEILDEYQIKTLEQAIHCEELWNINNGRTLCLNCHCRFNKGRYKKSENNYFYKK